MWTAVLRVAVWYTICNVCACSVRDILRINWKQPSMVCDIVIALNGDCWLLVCWCNSTGRWWNLVQRSCWSRYMCVKGMQNWNFRARGHFGILFTHAIYTRLYIDMCACIQISPGAARKSVPLESKIWGQKKYKQKLMILNHVEYIQCNSFKKH